jgi:hypothetical protein
VRRDSARQGELWVTVSRPNFAGRPISPKSTNPWLRAGQEWKVSRCNLQRSHGSTQAAAQADDRLALRSFSLANRLVKALTLS